MTLQEALIKIKSNPKWYLIPKKDGSVMNVMYVAQRIEDGRAKPETIKRFFSFFGYDIDVRIEIKCNG